MFKEIGEKAIAASKEVNQLNSDVKNNLIKDMSEQLIEDTDLILKANKKDLDNAEDLDLSSALVDRLTLTKERIEGIKKTIMNENDKKIVIISHNNFLKELLFQNCGDETYNLYHCHPYKLDFL